MSYKIEKISDEPVVICTLEKSFNLGRDTAAYAKELQELLDAQPGSVYLITDARQLQVSFGDLIQGLTVVARGELAVVRHPKILTLVTVGRSALLDLGSSALKQAQYGSLNIPVQVFTRMEDAWAYIQKDKERRRAKSK